MLMRNQFKNKAIKLVRNKSTGCLEWPLPVSFWPYYGARNEKKMKIRKNVKKSDFGPKNQIFTRLYCPKSEHF